MEIHEFPLKYDRPEITVVDLDRFRAGRMTRREMLTVTRAFAELGVICLWDSQVTSYIQYKFRQTMLEIHGASPEERAAMDGSDTGYQRGMTPPDTEHPLDHSAWVARLRPEHQPLTVPGRPDSKSRFMWAIGERPKRSCWPKINIRAKVPERFREIAGPLNIWGQCMLMAARDILQIVAIGLGLAPNRLSRMLENGPHILGPTGSDFTDAVLGRVLAGLHYDFNVVTVHGQTDIRALVCWTRDGRPFLVEVPDGCLLAQVGKSLEWMTGGFFFAGKHEVLVTPESLIDRDAVVARGERAIRTSSNLFVHLATRHLMRPIAGNTNSQARDKYPPLLGGHYASIELARIHLFPPEEIERCKALGPKHRFMIDRALATAYAA